MKKTYLLCLANSKKYGERCIAGIELMSDGNGRFLPVKINGMPKWVRPITEDGHGQVPVKYVQDVSVGDILGFNAVRCCPDGYQAENILFEKKSLEVIRRAELSVERLNRLLEDNGRYVFDNYQPCLNKEEIRHVNRSLVLIKTEKVKPYFYTPYNTKPRIKFLYKKNWYNFPVTDVNFIDAMLEDPELLDGKDEVFITVSLGVEFEGKYWKLAAGVMDIKKPREKVKTLANTVNERRR